MEVGGGMFSVIESEGVARLFPVAPSALSGKPVFDGEQGFEHAQPMPEGFAAFVFGSRPFRVFIAGRFHGDVLVPADEEDRYGDAEQDDG